MTTRILSKRAKTIFARFASLEVERAVETVKNLKQEELEQHNETDQERGILVNDWEFSLELMLPCHHEDCDHTDIPIPYGDRCDCEYEDEKWAMRLWYAGERDCPTKNLIANKIISARHDNSEKAIVGWINWLKEEWKTCVCGKEVARGDHCRDCFIHAYERTEEEGGDCCVCHENNGRWAKLSCGHVLHIHCWKKVVGNKCPLCRSGINHVKVRYDPYDV